MMSRSANLAAFAVLTIGFVILSVVWSKQVIIFSSLAVTGILAVLSLALKSEIGLRSSEEIRRSDALKAASDIERLSWQDQTSGLYSFNWFQEALEREVSRSQRYDQPCAILWINLDFQSLESQSIHAANANPAHIWRFVTDLIHAAVRTTDTVARRPGEYAVAVLLPQSDITGANIVAERLNERLKIETIEVVDGTNVHAVFHQHAVSFPVDGGSAKVLLDAVLSYSSGD